MAVVDHAEAAFDPADFAVDGRNGLIAVIDLPVCSPAADGAALAIEQVPSSNAVLQLVEVGDAQGDCVHERPGCVQPG